MRAVVPGSAGIEESVLLQFDDINRPQCGGPVKMRFWEKAAFHRRKNGQCELSAGPSRRSIESSHPIDAFRAGKDRGGRGGKCEHRSKVGPRRFTEDPFRSCRETAFACHSEKEKGLDFDTGILETACWTARVIPGDPTNSELMPA